MIPFSDDEMYRGGLRGLGSQSPSYPSQWQSFVRDTKKLYHKSLFKRCTGQCEKMLQDQRGKICSTLLTHLNYYHQLHPLHETFLHFHMALCYESLGLAAHKFSVRKLSLLNLAKDAFSAALVSLPSPHEMSHLLADEYIHFQRHKVDDRPHVDEMDVDRVDSVDRKPRSRQRSDEYCDSGYDSESESLPMSGRYQGSGFSFWSATEPSTTPMVKMQHERQANDDAISAIQDGKSEHTGEGDRLVPKPPFTNKRLSLSPSPSPPSPPPPSNAPAATATNIHTTTTLDQRRLSQASPISSTPNPTSTKTTDRAFNPNLKTFHTLLLKHLQSITTTIASTSAQQSNHRLLSQGTRFASFWSFEPASPSANSESESKSKRESESERVNYSRQAGRPTYRLDDDEEDEMIGKPVPETTRKRTMNNNRLQHHRQRERIERLRREGWMVRKEQHGWKGSEYYERLRGEAVQDLEVGE